MYFTINNYVTKEDEKIHTKRGAIVRINELLTNKDMAIAKQIVENTINRPHAVTFDNFAIRCVKEYEIEGIEEQLFELDELTDAIFYTDQDLTFKMAIEWFESTTYAKDMNDNPLGINWRTIVKRDYDHATFNYEYSDNLVNLYIDSVMYKFSLMSSGDIGIYNDLKIICH